MKPINIHFKKVATLFLIATTLLLTTCKKKTETVFITSNISVELFYLGLFLCNRHVD